jgi:hypothetical protein
MLSSRSSTFNITFAVVNIVPVGDGAFNGSTISTRYPSGMGEEGGSNL